MKKIILLCGLMLVFACASFGQKKNVAKLGIFGLASKNIKLSYERVLTQRMSVNLGLSYLLPRDMHSRFTDALTEQDSTQTAGGYTNSITDSYMKGISIIPELRIYSKKKDGAPRGFYFGPYFKFSNYKIGYEGIFDLERIETTGSLRTLGVGLSLGAHWMIKNIVTIDFNFLSVGWNFHKFTLEGTNYSNSFTPAESLEWEDDIRKEWEDIAIIGNNVEVSASGNTASIVSKFGFPAFRSGLSIGIAF